MRFGKKNPGHWDPAPGDAASGGPAGPEYLTLDPDPGEAPTVADAAPAPWPEAETALPLDLDVENQPTVGIFPSSGHAPAGGGQDVLPLDPAVDDGPTVDPFTHRSLDAQRDLAGWLVCTAGPDRGRDFRLWIGRSFVGSGTAMDVSVGDPALQARGHFSVVYDPVGGGFYAVPGEEGDLRRNGAPCLRPTPLQDKDCLEAGGSSFRFKAFLGEGFRWEDD